MTATVEPNVDQIEQERDAFIETLLDATAGVWKMFTIYLGNELGYYQALAGGEAKTAAELADVTGQSSAIRGNGWSNRPSPAFSASTIRKPARTSGASG
ncbi:MAG: hypothetical protein R2849_11840 [Thermomicrobiales bacterium]